MRVVQDMLGHSSIVLTADTYTSVLPDVARKAAEDVATLIIAAGCLVPGTTRPRQPERLGHGSTRWQSSASRAHPGRQVGRPRRTDPDINKSRLSGTAPAWRRNAHTMQQPALGHVGTWARGHVGIPRPTSAYTGLETKTTWGAKPQVRTGAPPGTRTPNPRIKSGRRNPLRAAGTGCCQRVPGHPSNHGATNDVHWSRPLDRGCRRRSRETAWASLGTGVRRGVMPHLRSWTSASLHYTPSFRWRYARSASSDHA
jgi:hypothetical protein